MKNSKDKKYFYCKISYRTANFFHDHSRKDFPIKRAAPSHSNITFSSTKNGTASILSVFGHFMPKPTEPTKAHQDSSSQHWWFLLFSNNTAPQWVTKRCCHQVLTYVEYRAVSSLASSKILTPHPPLHPASVSSTRTKAPSYMSPNAGRGEVAGSQPMSPAAVHRSPNKLWRSNSI